MQLREVMTRNVDVIHPEAPVREAAEMMRAADVGPIPVCDGERLVGMLTDRDIAIRAVALGRDPSTTHVRDVMTPEISFCFEDQDVDQAMQMMAERQIRRLPVLDANKRLVGIFSIGDIAICGGNVKRVGRAIASISLPTH